MNPTPCRYRIYGVDHSPWVQAVLIGLRLKRQDCDLTPLPSVPKLMQSGIRMPALHVNGQWQTESAAILEIIGFEAASKQDRDMVAATWQGVLHRTDSTLTFFNAFASIKLRHGSSRMRFIRQLLRPLVSIFFYSLIRLGVWRLKPQDPADFADQFRPVNDRLKTQPFLAGDAPGILDVQQFGIVQCHFSIPYQPLIAAMLEAPELNEFRGWVRRMHDQLADYPHLYSAGHFGDRYTRCESASLGHKAVFWLGLLLYLMLLPVTLSVIVLLILKTVSKR